VTPAEVEAWLAKHQTVLFGKQDDDEPNGLVHRVWNHDQLFAAQKKSNKSFLYIGLAILLTNVLQLIQGVKPSDLGQLLLKLLVH
jgi:hypothetical protein